ncbi:DUF7483 domain-containing protein [Kiloniella sp. b19]|uniref:DUF7483 domain-containing protein n=1 Tax=Kiloniella sp. GXU_MW_B19 TaxID=3141326 RepID=UPI0031DEF88F
MVELHSINPLLGCGDPGDPIEYSCHFDGNAYMYRDFQAGNRKIYAERVLFKLLGDVPTPLLFLNAAGAVGTYAFNYLYNGQIHTAEQQNHSEHLMYVLAKNRHRDFAGFVDMLRIVDTTKPTASERVEYWFNGRKSSFAAQTWPALNRDTFMNQAVRHYLGTFYPGSVSSAKSQALKADYIFFDGKTPSPTDFGYFNAYGHWVPRLFEGKGQGEPVYGTNGFHLDFSDPLDLGKDVSGNGNHFTTMGMTSDNQSTDTPSNNENLMSVLDGKGVTNTEAGKRFAFPSSYVSVRSNFAVHGEGPFELEIEATTTLSGNNILHIGMCSSELGIVNRAMGQSSAVPGALGMAVGKGYEAATQQAGSGSVLNVETPTSYPSGTRIKVVWRKEDAELDFWVAGVKIWTTPMDISGPVHFFLGGYASGCRVTSLKAGSLKAAPCPDILNPDDYFTERVAVNGAPVNDMPWNMEQVETLTLSYRQDAKEDTRVSDTIDGAGLSWATNTTGGIASHTGTLAAYQGNGYSFPDRAGIWVDYHERISRETGLDVINVDHVNGTPTTASHHLGRPVEFAIVVPHSGGNRRVFHKDMVAGRYLTLNKTETEKTDPNWISSTAVDVTINGSLPTGRYKLILHCSVENYKDIGIYKGTSSNDGAFVLMPFAPRMVMIFRPDIVGNHHLSSVDADGGDNPVQRYLNLESGGSGTTIRHMDFLSNGIKNRDDNSDVNGGEPIYLSIAGTPLKFARGQ